MEIDSSPFVPKELGGVFCFVLFSCFVLFCFQSCNCVLKTEVKKEIFDKILVVELQPKSLLQKVEGTEGVSTGEEHSL